ncbi:MAG: hypothetical protein R2873_08800 [Caldilineaceae bacterium]
MQPQRASGNSRTLRFLVVPAVVLTLIGVFVLGVVGFQPHADAAGSARAGVFRQIMSAAQSVTVSVTSNQFISQTVEIQAGDTVTWTLVSGLHSVTADDDSFEQPLGSDWGSFSRRFDIPGEYLYYCSLHGGPNGFGMAGEGDRAGR